MSTHKALNTMISLLMIASLLLGATTRVSAKEVQPSTVAGNTRSMPTDPTDESKVPHYFGPWPNWANSPFTLPNASVEIQGDGSGATAVAKVNPVTQGLDSIEITSPGSGYTFANVVITGGNNDAAATATVNASGSVIAVEVGAGGAGYISPQVSFSGGHPVAPIGNALIDRAFATDVAPAVPVFVIVPAPLPAGFVTDFLVQNQAAPAGTPSAGQSFNAYVLRATGVPNEYLVVFDSGLLTVPALADPNTSEMAVFPVGNIAVQAGDVIAFYGAGVPFDSGAGADLYASPAPAAPVQGGTVTFPTGGEARTYSFAANVVSGNATGIAYGGVDEVTIISGGSGYSMPTIEFDLPDAPDGISAKGHVASTALGDSFDGLQDGSILPNGIIVDEPGSGYLSAPGVAIHDGTVFDPLNGATLASATTTLKITSVVLETYGSGYVSAPQVTFSDSTGSGSGASATASVDVGSITAINVTAPGSGYLTVGMRKFIDELPQLCAPPNCPSYQTNPTAKYIPLAVPEAKKYNGIEADEYVIGLVQYRTSFSSDLKNPVTGQPVGTLVRGYVQLETPANQGISQHYPLQNELLDGTKVSTGYLAVTPPQWLGPVIAATKNKPVRIVFRNLLPNGEDGDLFLPVDASMMGSGMGPMDMPMAPMDDGSVMDEVRNPTCTDNPQAKHWDAAMGMMMDSCFKNNRATLHLHGGITPWISDGTAHQWITPAGEMASWPQGVSVSEVPDMNVCAAADDGCMTFYYTNQQSARLLFYHDHSWGITRLNVYAGEAAGYVISDETEAALLAPGGAMGDDPATPSIDESLGLGMPLIVQDRTFVPDAAQLALQDPTWDTARWGTKGSFWYHHVYMPAQNPGDPGGMSAFGRWMYGPWFWPPAADTKYGPIANPYYDPNCHLDDPATWQYDTDPFCEPQEIPGTPLISAGMEQFNDTPIVNGVAYPKVTLAPKSYRFRILNAANDRFFNFQWYIADPTQGNGLTEVALNPDELAAAQTDPVVFPTPVQGAATAGPDWIQIGTEGGFLPAPVVIDGQQPTTWIGDPTVFNVGNVDQHSLLLAPAERADVIVDFSQFAGKTLILYNDAPAAFPARIPSYDYYTGAPDLSPVGAPTILPGYGPNTRTIMQVTIAGSPAPAFNLTKLRNAFRHNASGTGVFESGQHPVIVGQAAYNSAYGTSFAAGSNCNAPGSTTQRCDGFLRVNDTTTFGFNTLLAPTVKTTLHVEPKAIHDETNSTTFDEYGRMQANLGVEAQPPTPGLQNVTLYPFVNPGTEIIDATNLPRADVIYDVNTGRPIDDVKITPLGDANDGTQIWRITHNGVDTHPIHFHLYDVQLLNRVSWDNIVAPPELNELGWKDTVRVAPLEDTIFAIRPIIPELPWELPNAIRMLNPMMPEGSEEMFNNIDVQGDPTNPITNQLVNFGWEYVYHCHILSHEEMDMMRPVSVALPPIKPDGLQFDNGVLSWNDNSITETAFVVQRNDGSGWVDLQTIPSPLNVPNTHRTGDFAVTFTDSTYNPSNDYQYRVIARNTVGYGGQFPSMTVESVSDALRVGDPLPPSVVSIERTSANPSSAPSVGFRVIFSQPVNGVDALDFAPLTSGTISGPLVSTISGSGSTYTVTLSTGTGAGTLGLAVVDNDSIVDAGVPSMPLGGPGLVNGDFTAGQTYTVDYTPPIVVSSTRLNTNPTTLSAVNFKVTFSESVVGVDATDFSLTATGLTNASIASVTGTGTTRSVRVNTGTGTGTLRLNVVDNDTIKDVLFVPLGGTGIGNGSFSTGQSFTVDRNPPSVLSSVRLDPNPTPHGTLRFEVTFSEPVTGVDLADFSLATTGSISGASLTSVTGTGATYTVALNSGTGSGTIRLDVLDNDTIRDALNNPLGGTGTQNYTTGESYSVNPPPAVVSIVRASANPTSAASVNYTVTFSEAVTGVDTADFALAVTGDIASASVTGVTGAGTSYTVAVNTGTGSGTLRLDLMDDNSIIDGTSIPLGGAGAQNYITGEIYNIDRIAPTVVSIVRASASPTGAASVNYTVTFSEAVTGVDMADFALTLTGITGASVTGVTGTGTARTVSVNTGSGNGTLRLDLMDNNSIIDSTSVPLGGAGTQDFLTGEIYDIDKIVPAVVSILAASPNPTGAASVDYTVTFSKSVTGVGTADFALTLTGSITGPSVTSISGSGTTYTVVVNTGAGPGTLRLDLMDDNSIVDAAGNPLGGAGAQNYTTGEVYTIDPTPPAVVSIVHASANPTNAASVDYTVTFSEAVTGVDTADFALTLTGITGASVTSVTGTGTTRTVSVNTGSGDGTLRLDLMDDNSIVNVFSIPLGGAGAQNYTGGGVYDIDKTAPAVVSILPASVSPTNAASVNYTVTFSEAVTGVDTADFALTLTGITGASVTGVTGTGTTRTVSVNTGSGNGTLRLDLMDDNSIVDAASNPLGGAGAQNYTGGGVYDIDKIAPTVVSIVRASASPTNAANVNYTVTFSEAVTGVGTADFALTLTGGITGASVASVTPVSGALYTVAVNTGSGDGTLRLDLMDDNSIVDAASNPLGGAGAQNYTGGGVYDIDKTAPAVVSILPASVSPTNAASVNYTVTFSEAVTGVDTADFALTLTGITGASVTSVTGTGTARTVSVNTGSGNGTLRLDLMDDNSIVDAANSPLGGAGAQNYTGGGVYDIDKIAPTVVSIVRGSASPTNAANVNYTVTFSEAVTGVGTADFALTLTSGITGASVASVMGVPGPQSQIIYTVAVNTGTGSGTLRLDLMDDNSIVDAASNPLGGAGAQNYTGGGVYDIDKIAPTVVSIVRASGNPSSAASVDYTVTFSEAVTGVDVNDFAFTVTGDIAGHSVAAVSGSGATYNVAINTGTGNGTLSLLMPTGAIISDPVGNSLGGLPFTGAESYTLQKIPNASTLVSPTGSIMTNNPSYTWSAVPGATWYYLLVEGPSGTVAQKWYAASEANCNGTTCSVTNATTGLAAGTYSWWIQTYNSIGYGAWSSEMIFTPTAPGQSTLSSPAGNTADVTPLYTWSAVPGATWYYLWVTGSSSTVITQFYPASAVCSGSTCSVEQPTPLSSGTYNWWIQTYGEVGYGPWSSGLSFTTVAPGPAVLSSPTGSIMTNNPSYTWSAVPGATWYYLLVEGPSGTVTQKWYAASEANCNGTTCSVANATTGLAAGTYSWWIQTYNSIGYGAWSSEMIFTTP